MGTPYGPSIFEVARVAGVSRATAARALGGYGSVSPAAKQRVQDAAHKLGYSINSVARSMVTGQSMTLGAIIADIANPFFARVIRGFTDGAREHGYEVVLINTDESVQAEIQGVRLLTQKRVDGIAIAPVSRTSFEHLSTLIDRGQAVVQFDRYIPGLDTDLIVVDNYDASFRAVGRVLAAGHRRVAAPRLRITSDDKKCNEVSTMTERHQGYLDAMTQAGLEIPAAFTPSGRRREEIGSLVERLLTDPEPPTAIFGLDDSFMLGILDAAYRVDVEIPGQLSIFGFDDTDWSTVVRPALTVIAQPAYELGLQAAQVLIGRIRRPDEPSITRTLTTTWVERGSVAAPPR